MGDDSHYSAGFSILEVMVTLLIFSAITSMFIINLQPAIGRQKMDSARSSLAAIVQQARLKNLRTGEPIELGEYIRTYHPDKIGSAIVLGRALISSAGACSEANVKLIVDGTEALIEIEHITCDLGPVR